MQFKLGVIGSEIYGDKSLLGDEGKSKFQKLNPQMPQGPDLQPNPTASKQDQNSDIIY